MEEKVGMIAENPNYFGEDNQTIQDQSGYDVGLASPAFQRTTQSFIKTVMNKKAIDDVV